MEAVCATAWALGKWRRDRERRQPDPRPPRMDGKRATALRRGDGGLADLVPTRAGLGGGHRARPRLAPARPEQDRSSRCQPRAEYLSLHNRADGRAAVDARWLAEIGEARLRVPVPRATSTTVAGGGSGVSRDERQRRARSRGYRMCLNPAVRTTPNRLAPCRPKASLWQPRSCGANHPVGVRRVHPRRRQHPRLGVVETSAGVRDERNAARGASRYRTRSTSGSRRSSPPIRTRRIRRSCRCGRRRGRRTCW